jgi:hypothetical protein
MTLWFHLPCAAFKRPQPFLDALAELGAADEVAQAIEGRRALEAAAQFGLAHRRLPRLDGVQRAPSGRAKCRSCREPIELHGWRIPLVYYEEGRFEPSGHIHLRCAPAYFETDQIMDRLVHFAPDLTPEEIEEIRRQIHAA